MFIKRGDDPNSKIITVVRPNDDVLDADVKEAMEKMKTKTTAETIPEKDLEKN